MFILKLLNHSQFKGKLSGTILYDDICSLTSKINTQLQFVEPQVSDDLLTCLYTAEAYYLTVGYHLVNHNGKYVSRRHFKALTIYLVLLAIETIIEQQISKKYGEDSITNSSRARNPYLYNMH